MAVLAAEVRDRALAAARAFDRRAAVRAAYVFGSQAEGRADEWSDIDLAVFMDAVEGWDARKRARVIVQVQKEVGFDVEPHLFPASALANPLPASFAEYILRRGTRLDFEGVVEAVE